MALPTGGGGATAELQAQQMMLQLQQMQMAALQQQAMQRQALQQRAMQQRAMQMQLAQQSSGGERTGGCDRSGSERVNLTPRTANRDTGDRFASQRANAELRREMLLARIDAHEAELQRRRDRAAAGR